MDLSIPHTRGSGKFLQKEENPPSNRLTLTMNLVPKIRTMTLVESLIALAFSAGLFAAEPGPVPVGTSVPIAQAKYIPQRKDDIAWENDRIVHRIYGPALEKSEPTGSGIDVWVKSVRYPVIDKWYQNGQYHEDTGEGLDFYSVRKSRGCGGLGIWDGKTLSVSGHWQSYEIRETGGGRAVFVVSYAPWKLPDGHEVSETRTFTVTNGSNLTLCESTLRSDEPELVVGIGIAKRKDGELYQNKESGVMAYWQSENPKNGYIGLGVIAPPQQIVGFAEDELNNLVLVKAKPGIPFAYRTGACWSKGSDFHSFEEWKNYLQQEEK